MADASSEKPSWSADPEITEMIAADPGLIDDKLTSAMQKLLNNPASLTITLTPFNEKETSLGHFQKVYVNTLHGTVDGLILDKAEIDFEDVQLDTTKLIREEKIDPVNVKSINMDVIITEKDLNDFLAVKAQSLKVRNPKVNLNPGKMQLSGSAKYGIVRVNFWAEGGFSVKDSKEVWFHPHKMKLNSMTMPRAFVGSLVKRINPVLNLDKFPFRLNLSEIKIEKGALHFTSKK